MEDESLTEVEGDDRWWVYTVEEQSLADFIKPMPIAAPPPEPYLSSVDRPNQPDLLSALAKTQVVQAKVSCGDLSGCHASPFSRGACHSSSAEARSKFHVAIGRLSSLASLVGVPKGILKSRAYDLAYLFLDPKCPQKTRGGLSFAKKRLLVAANRRFSDRFCPRSFNVVFM